MLTRRSLLLQSAAALAAGKPALIHSCDPPAAAGSGMAYLAPGRDGSLLLSWLEPTGAKGQRMRISRWRDGSWGSPWEVASGENWFVNWADFPSIIELPSGTILAHRLERIGFGKYGYGIHVTHASGWNQPWSTSMRMSPGDPEDYTGFLSFTPTINGGAAAAYLAPPAEPKAGEHRKTLRYIEIDSAGAGSNDREIDPDVCSCCQTAIAAMQHRLVIAYRDHMAGEIRDISLLLRENGRWSAPRTLHADKWMINGCPSDGPSLAAHGDFSGIAWLTRANEQPRIQAALGSTGASSFGPPVRVDDGNPLGRPAVVAHANTLFIVWLEKTASGAEVRLKSLNSQASLGRSVCVATVAASRAAGFPKLAVVGDRLLIAWREQRVRAAWIDVKSLPKIA